MVRNLLNNMVPRRSQKKVMTDIDFQPIFAQKCQIGQLANHMNHFLLKRSPMCGKIIAKERTQKFLSRAESLTFEWIFLKTSSQN